MGLLAVLHPEANDYAQVVAELVRDINEPIVVR
jgi:hypothetical protein